MFASNHDISLDEDDAPPAKQVRKPSGVDQASAHHSVAHVR